MRYFRRLLEVVQRMKVVETAAKAKIHSALRAMSEDFVLSTVNALIPVVCSLLANLCWSWVAEGVSKMRPIRAQLHVRVPPWARTR